AAPWVGRLPLAPAVYHKLKGMLQRERITAIPEILRRDYGITAPVRFFDHHYTHAAAAYFTSGFDEALVVTLDGGGDGLSGTVYTGRNGKLRRLAKVDSFNSLGNIYSYVTALCGFRAEKDEGKITGLAAIGRPVYADIIRRFIRSDGNGGMRYPIPMYHVSAVRRMGEALPADYDRADLAASVQLVLEEVGVEFVRYWVRKTGLRNLAVAGGVFANVKFNQRVHEIEGVELISIHPAMDDGGLSVGAAMAYVSEQSPQAAVLSHRLPNVYLGPDFDDGEIRRSILEAGFTPCRPENIHRAVAEKLAQGDVVARFWGRMEYGPRALGARSILYQTGDPSVNNWLNERLKRTEFMPFAPATLMSHAVRCYRGMAGAKDSARFMTITFDCTEEMAEQSPGVVHVDGTARPQLVDEETAPDFHAILTEYHALTGVPSVINTSFNMHEEPIVCTPSDALRAFQLGRLEWLAIGPYLIRGREGNEDG
ncbi:MAG TPA: carbamoyltransferase C-terminal domain-containing protein, partial [Longimicrobiales bacterium]|nr:carbamoyltransferase C-terminal domain-containing protein [Longimicrobiales bacterium]